MAQIGTHLQRFCIVRHLREIKGNYLRDREKFNKLVRYAVLPHRCLQHLNISCLLIYNETPWPYRYNQGSRCSVVRCRGCEFFGILKAAIRFQTLDGRHDQRILAQYPCMWAA